MKTIKFSRCGDVTSKFKKKNLSVLVQLMDEEKTCKILRSTQGRESETNHNNPWMSKGWVKH